MCRGNSIRKSIVRTFVKCPIGWSDHTPYKLALSFPFDVFCFHSDAVCNSRNSFWIYMYNNVNSVWMISKVGQCEKYWLSQSQSIYKTPLSSDWRFFLMISCQFLLLTSCWALVRSIVLLFLLSSMTVRVSSIFANSCLNCFVKFATLQVFTNCFIYRSQMKSVQLWMNSTKDILESKNNYQSIQLWVSRSTRSSSTCLLKSSH